MKTQVEFRSSIFPPYDDEEEIINPGRYGKRLAEYIHVHLPKYGFEVEDIYSEDWGWGVPIKNDKFSLWVGCGNQDEFEDGFLCFIEPSKPYIKKLFKKIDISEIVTKLVEALESIFLSEKDITGINWLETNTY